MQNHKKDPEDFPFKEDIQWGLISHPHSISRSLLTCNDKTDVIVVQDRALFICESISVSRTLKKKKKKKKRI